MYKLNKSEKKVISLLEQDCRISSRQIAKKARLSTQGVIKIINRLIKKKIIIKFNTKINYTKIGYSINPVHIKLNKLNKEIADQIKNTLKKYKCCVWNTFAEGEYDLLLSFKILDHKEKLDMYDALLELSPHILEKDVSMVTNAFAISKSFLEQTKDREFFTTVNLDHVKESLSEKDFKLIELLRTNSRNKIITLAAKLNTTSKSVILNIKSLKQKKVISGFKTTLNLAKLNLQPCTALITLQKHKQEDYNRLVNYCKNKRQINYFIKQVGKYDIHLDFDVKDINEFYELVDDIRNNFDFIKKITTLIIKKNY